MTRKNPDNVREFPEVKRNSPDDAKGSLQEAGTPRGAAEIPLQYPGMVVKQGRSFFLCESETSCLNEIIFPLKYVRCRAEVHIINLIL